MKVRSEREKTKVVIRHLSPSLTLSDFFPTHRFSLRFSLQLVLLPSRQQQVITIQTLPVCSLCNPNKSLIIIIICSHKRQMHSRAYIDFKCPDDVFEFTEFFDGHVFVNERGILFLYFISLTLHPLEWHRFYTGMYVQSGAQHKVIVEYAPSQRVPKPSAKKMDVKGLYSKVDVMLI